jgi:hypothetical protein
LKQTRTHVDTRNESVRQKHLFGQQDVLARSVMACWEQQADSLHKMRTCCRADSSTTAIFWDTLRSRRDLRPAAAPACMRACVCVTAARATQSTQALAATTIAGLLALQQLCVQLHTASLIAACSLGRPDILDQTVALLSARVLRRFLAAGTEITPRVQLQG